MLASKWLLFLALCLGGLHKAIAGKTSSSKRKASESESEDWAHFALHLHSSNQLPGTEAKRNIEKASRAGAKGLKLKAKKGKKCCEDFEEGLAQNHMAKPLLGPDSNKGQKD